MPHLVNTTKQTVTLNLKNGKEWHLQGNQALEIEDESEFDLLIEEHPELIALQPTKIDGVMSVDEQEVFADEGTEAQKRIPQTPQEAFEESLRKDQKVACSICGKLFRNNRNKQVHIKFMHPENPYAEEEVGAETQEVNEEVSEKIPEEETTPNDGNGVC